MNCAFQPSQDLQSKFLALSSHRNCIVEDCMKKIRQGIKNVEKIFDRRHRKSGNYQKPDITNPEVPGEGGEGGDEGGDGEDGGDGFQTPDITNPEVPFE